MASLDNIRRADGTLDARLLGRIITSVENIPEYAESLLAEEYRANPQALIIGVTGPPGAGKSTLTDGLVALYREQGKQVAVIAVDSSSPFSGGAILGDRIRMSEHATDAGVFIRSMGSRGSLGGVAPATLDVMNVLITVGFDVIIIETVGVGQSEVDIMLLADTVLLVLMPGMGDDIQALKAGIMEIADVFVVNKADKPGTEKLLAEINMLLILNQERMAWIPPVVEMVASEKKGLDRLMEAIQKHTAYIVLEKNDAGLKRRQARFRHMLEEKMRMRIRRTIDEDRSLETWTSQICARETNPYMALKEFERRIKINWEE